MKIIYAGGGVLTNSTQVKQDWNTAAYFFGFVKKRFLLFWGTEFLIGLSPPVLAN